MTPPNKTIHLKLDSKVLHLSQELKERNRVKKLSKYITHLKAKKSILHALNQLKLLEISQDLKKPSLAIYDHAFHFIGGAQKYGLTLASALQNEFNLTIIASKPVELNKLETWYNLDLSQCSLRVARLGFFDRLDPVYIDPSRVSGDTGNPFTEISKISAEYDIFINNSMLEMVYPLSLYSVMVCHFPERRPASFFYSDRYDQVIYNSRYTSYWIKKRWNFEPHTHLYPPVDMQVYSDEDHKDKLIISVARFEVEGTKKQLELLKSFHSLCKSQPAIGQEWSLVLIGGSPKKNPYLDSIRRYISDHKISNCTIETNIPDAGLKEYYSRASMFWHLCGLGENDPAKIEHFGMTIAEAMQNQIVPLVFDGGGQKEIVENNLNGFRVSSAAELIHQTRQLIEQPANLKKLARNAFIRSQDFSRDRFTTRVKTIFGDILRSLKN